MASPSQSIFRNLAGQMPGQNQQVVTGLQEAAKSQMQQQIGGQLTGQPMGIRQIQQAGQQAAAAQAQPILQVQQQAQQQARQAGQLALQEEERSAQQRIQERQFNQTKLQRQLDSQLNTLNTDLKQRLTDDQFKFQKDELGRTLFNDRQLMDFKLATAKSALDLKNFEQKMRQASQRKVTMLKAAQAKIKQELAQSYQAGEQELDQEQKKRLTIAAKQLEEKIKKAQNRAKNQASMISAAGSIITTAGVYYATGGTAAAADLILASQGGRAGGSILNSLFSE